MAAKKTKSAPKRSSSFALMVGDDGAILVHMQGKKVLRRLFAQSPETMHTKTFEDVLKSAPQSPITMLVDFTDQSYVSQTLPPVSVLSVGKIIRRRMEKDFPADDINGYRMLGREKTGRKDWSYLMVSAANSPVLQKWIAFAVERPNPFLGMGMVPLEAEPMLLAAQKELLKKKGKEAKPLEWQMLVSHHKVGGFRQVVLRNGKLAFTRMAQLVGEMLPAVIAGNIEQEMVNTLEYLKRMGLQDLNSLSLIIVASDEIRQALERKPVQSGDYYFFTPHEMAALLGIPEAAQAEDHFGDGVISMFVNARRKLLLPMHTPYTQRIAKFTNMLLYMRVGLVMGILALVGWAGDSAWDMIGAQQQKEKVESEKTKFQGQLAALKSKTITLPKELQTYTDVSALSQIYDKRRGDVLSFISTFASTLEGAGQVTQLSWSLSDPLSVTRDTDKRMISADLSLHLTSPRTPSDQYIANAATLMDRIKNSFHGYEVTNTELPGMVAENKEMQTTIDDTAQTPKVAPGTQIDSVKVTIHGPTDKKAPNGR